MMVIGRGGVGTRAVLLSAALLLFSAARSSAAAAVDEASSRDYGYYTDLRRSNEPLRSDGNVDVYYDPHGEEGREEEVGICHLYGMHSFSWPVGGGAYVGDSWEYNAAPAALLAMHHFNNGDGSIAPALGGINERCSVRFTAEFSDTKADEFEALRLLTEVVTRRRKPCAILGASRSASTMPTSMLSSVHGLPQMSWSAGSSDLNDRHIYRLFSRVISSTDANAEVSVRYLAKELGMRHCAVMFLNDAFANAQMRTFNERASREGMTIQSVTVPVDINDEVVRESIDKVKETGYRCIYTILDPTHYETFMEEAHRQGIAGPSYFWFLGNGKSFSDSYKEGSPLDIASQGVCWATSSEEVPGYENFEKAWASLSNDAKEYFNSVLPAPPDTPADFLQLYHPEEVYPSAYDTVVAIGLAACNIANGTNYFTGEELSEAIVQRTAFQGASGHVVIDNATGSRKFTSERYDIVNFRRVNSTNGTSYFEEVMTSAFLPNADATEWIHNETIGPAFVYSDGTTEQPPDLPPVNGGGGVDMNYIGNMRYLAYCLFAIVVIISSAFVAWTVHNRKMRVVTASQPVFLLMICAGVAIMASTMIPLSVDDEHFSARACNAACMSVPWLVCLGFVIVFAGLFSKTWRVNKIVRNPGSYRRVAVGVKDVIAPLVIFTLMNIIVLICWSVIAPLRFVREDEDIGTDQFNRVVSSYGSCISDGGATPYIVVLAIINFSILCFANFQAYLSRAIDTDYSESKYIAVVMASMLQAWLIGIPILVLVKDDPQVLFVVCTLMLFIMSMAILLLIFVPKQLSLKEYKREREKKRAEKEERRIRLEQSKQTYDATHEAMGGAISMCEQSEGATGLRYVITRKSMKKLGVIDLGGEAQADTPNGNDEAEDEREIFQVTMEEDGNA